MRAGNHKTYVIAGVSPELDDELGKTWPNDVCEFSSATGPFDCETEKCISVIGDFVFVISLNSTLASEIEALGSSWTEHIGKRIPLRFVLEHNPKKAKRLKRKFSDFFGIPTEI